MQARLSHAERPLRGALSVPGDKSISHRAVILASMAEGTSRLTGVLDSADVRSTIAAVRGLGADVEVTQREGGIRDCLVRGWGADGPSQPDGAVDCGNSGTTARLLMGVVAGWPVRVTFTGDESLSARPMRRVLEPLESMGASTDAEAGGRMPVHVTGAELSGIRYRSPVASAQVKSAVLLAGIRAHGTTTVVEPAPSRDHTERMLPAFGAPVSRDIAACSASVSGRAVLVCCDVDVPRDPSSAAFLVGAALLVPGSEIRLPDVCVNPTRTGFLHVLDRMGASVSVEPGAETAGEVRGRIIARHTARMTATTVLPAEVPALIDEVPLLAVVATAATGVTRFEGIGELRVKETDRLAAIADGLVRFGAQARAGEDWLEVTGPARLHGCTIASKGDHRLAMAWAVAALAASGETAIDAFEAVDVSYPGFLAGLDTLGAGGQAR